MDIWKAISDYNVLTVKELINSNIDINQIKNNYTPLYLTCSSGYIEIVKLLLNVEGIDVNKGVINNDITSIL